ncbi:MAG TPA: hypothetical protein VK691_08530 [Solirubrobacteraceae bacterium]|nr:hypothetical protein [Solirubrobacteraceae bacterium]
MAKLSDHLSAGIGGAGREAILARATLLQVAELNECGGAAMSCGAAESSQIVQLRYA